MSGLILTVQNINRESFRSRPRSILGTPGGGAVLDDQGRVAGLIAFSEEGQNPNYAIAAAVVSDFVSRARRSARRRGVDLPPRVEAVLMRERGS